MSRERLKTRKNCGAPEVWCIGEVKPCPLCGSKEAKIEVDGGFAWGECMKCGAALRVVLFIVDKNNAKIAAAAKYWDARPIEDALTAKIAELEQENTSLREQEVFWGGFHDYIVLAEERIDNLEKENTLLNKHITALENEPVRSKSVIKRLRTQTGVENK